MYQLPSLAQYDIAPETLPASGTLTAIGAELDTAQALKALLDTNPYKPKHDSYLSWTHNPAGILVSLNALPLRPNTGDELPETFVLARTLDNGTGLYTAELQAEADWYAKITPRRTGRTGGLLAGARRVASMPAVFDAAAANTIAYGATTVYAYPGGTLLAITDVVARIGERKVEVAAGAVTQDGSATEAARRSLHLVNSIVGAERL